MNSRTITLLGCDVLFVALALLILRFPDLALALYPGFGLIFFWSYLRRESELSAVFVFLVIAAGVLLGARAATEHRWFWLVEIVAAAGLPWTLSSQRARLLSSANAMAIERAAYEKRMREDERDLSYYRSYQKSAESQIRLRKDFSENAKVLAGTIDAGEVRARLSAILASRFPRATVEIVGASNGEPLLELAASRGSSWLVNDSAVDERFRGATFRSALAVPLRVQHQPAGFVRLASPEPGTFTPEDMQAVDFLSTMAAIALENVQFYEQVHQQATHDPLTQLHSHKSFQTRLHEELLRAGRAQTPLSVIMADIDHFKTYNDRYGHQAGDQLLRTVSSLLASFARPVDMVARYGGEEFTLILPNFVRSEAVDLANRICARVASEPFLLRGESTQVTISLGVAGFPQDATTASQIVRVADERLYRAKNGGRNQVVG